MFLIRSYRTTENVLVRSPRTGRDLGGDPRDVTEKFFGAFSRQIRKFGHKPLTSIILPVKFLKRIERFRKSWRTFCKPMEAFRRKRRVVGVPPGHAERRFSPGVASSARPSPETISRLQHACALREERDPAWINL